nr:hypothetical protein [uncultured Prevotella sp.]
MRILIRKACHSRQLLVPRESAARSTSMGRAAGTSGDPDGA